MSRKEAWQMICLFALATATWMTVTLIFPWYAPPTNRFEDGAERVFFFAFGVFSTLQRLKP